MILSKNFCYSVGLGLVVLFLTSPLAAFDIPPFKPNVVDTSGTLSSDEQAEINAALETVRQRAKIWGAVLIVESLEGESIESVAERAFRRWEIGQKGVDNELLLVLSSKGLLSNTSPLARRSDGTSFFGAEKNCEEFCTNLFDC